MPGELLYKETLVIAAGTLCQLVSACTHSTLGFSYCRARVQAGGCIFYMQCMGEKKHAKSSVKVGKSSTCKADIARAVWRASLIHLFM